MFREDSVNSIDIIAGEFTKNYCHTCIYIRTYIPTYIHTSINTYMIFCKYPEFILYISKTRTKYLTNYNTLHSQLSTALYNRRTHALCQHKRHVCYRLLGLTQNFVIFKLLWGVRVWDSGFESYWRHEYLCFVNVVRCQVWDGPILRPEEP